MSQQNVELLRQGLEAYFQAFVDAYAREGFEGLAASFWHPDIEYREDPKWPEAATYRGRDAVLAAFKGYEDVMGHYAIALERVVDAGEEFALVIRASGRGASSGAPHEYRSGYIGRLVDGLCGYLQAYLHADEALERVGREGR
jgi:ketosteroid isomerase-like protein